MKCRMKEGKKLSRHNCYSGLHTAAFDALARGEAVEVGKADATRLAEYLEPAGAKPKIETEENDHGSK